MRMRTKIWLIAASILVVIGLGMMVFPLAANRWDFTLFNTSPYTSATYTVADKFSSISVQTVTADIRFAPSDDVSCTVVCREPANVHHSAAVQNGTLIITVTDTRKWYEYIGITVETPSITVYLPHTQYAALRIEEDTGSIEIPKEFSFESMDITASTGDIKNYASAADSIKICADTGDIRIENVSASHVELYVSTGDIFAQSINCSGSFKTRVSTGKTELTGIRCADFTSDGSTGDIYLTDVLATQSLGIKRSTGDILFKNCDAAELDMQTDTGNIAGSLLTAKIFIVQTDTGKVFVPQTASGGKCTASTDTGSIKIELCQ